MNNLISVIIPVYKVEKYLKRCVDSVLTQTYENLEIILVDDGSPDNCPMICDTYAWKDTRIKVIHQENAGLSEARNAGLRIAKGEYIAFLDSDDYIAPNMYDEMLKLIQNADADLAICNVQRIYEDGIVLKDANKVLDEVFSSIDMLKEITKPNNTYYITVWNKLYKRDLFDNLCFEKGKLNEDEFIIHTILGKCTKVVTTSKKYYYYFVRKNSIMTQKITVKHLDAIEAMYDRFLFYREKEELQKCLPELCTQCGGYYLAIMKKLHVERCNRPRVKEVQAMYVEMCKEGLKDAFTWKSKMKCYFPKLYIWLVHLYLSVDQIVRLLKCIYKILWKGWGRTYILVDTPEHGNLGDQALVLAEKQFLDEVVGAHTYIEITANEMDKLEHIIAKFVSRNKVILIQGGGFAGDIWTNEELRIHRILKAFSKQKIIFFPQTVFYDLKEEYSRKLLETAQKCYGEHKDLTVFVREQKSDQFMKDHFPTVRSYLVPDMVLSYKQEISSSVRKGVLLCIRKDREKQLDARECAYIEECLWNKFGKNAIRYTDTVVKDKIKNGQREKAFHNKLREFAGAELVVTDRLHGMIFAAITGTPCIAFGNTSGKVKGVYEWIKHLDYVRYVEQMESFETVLKEINLGVVYSYTRLGIQAEFEPLRVVLSKDVF